MIQENSAISEKTILSIFTTQKGLFSPLEIRSVKPAVFPGSKFDAQIVLGWGQRDVKFLVEVKARTAPKLINEAVWWLKSQRDERRSNLMLVVPYLSKMIVEILEREGVSGLDLNGNYMIQTPDMVAIRLDRENRFPESQSIKKIFSGSSSLVGRLLLSEKKSFGSVNEVYSSIQRLGASLSLSAVSKVLKGLEDDLIIEKGDKGIVLLQPDKLLKKLEEGYRPLKILSSLKLRIPVDSGVPYGWGHPGLYEALADTKWIASGETSAFRYALSAGGAIPRIYVADDSALAKFRDEKFFNLLAQKTDESFPFFDPRPKGAIRYSSPIQCFLELSKLDKREQEIAETVRQDILKQFK